MFKAGNGYDAFIEWARSDKEDPIKDPIPEPSMMLTDVGAAGLAAVWARENTRESIWDAMKRREVYATTGTRICVRVFAGWDFTADEVQRPDFAREGYRRGVPMGGDLDAAPTGKAPRFMVRALRDPDGANLDRIQIIKGWLDSDGKTHERIFESRSPTGGPSTRTAAARHPSETRSTSRTRPTRTPSEMRSSPRTGRIRRSIRSRSPSITCGSSRSRMPEGSLAF